MVDEGPARYTSSLQALSHALVIAPQNPFYVLQFAETAASNGDWALALKMFLRSVEMLEHEDTAGGGEATRGWMGVKLVS
jgi:cytochrome c-type biogenesis protein CcmH/NrfG